MPAVSAGLLLYRWATDAEAAPPDAEAARPDAEVARPDAEAARPDAGALRLEVLLVHPGGPYWARKDAGAWSIPKGEAEPGELGEVPATVTAAKLRNRAAGVDLLAVALREVREETGLEPAGPFQPLGGVKAHHHKLVFAWAVEHDCDPGALVSEAFTMEWPPRSGQTRHFPEVDRAAWFTLPAAREAVVPAQRRFVDDLEILVGAGARREAP